MDFDQRKDKWAPIFRKHAGKLFTALADLVEWATQMGGCEAPCWQVAKRLLERIRDERDGAVVVETYKGVEIHRGWHPATEKGRYWFEVTSNSPIQRKRSLPELYQFKTLKMARTEIEFLSGPGRP